MNKPLNGTSITVNEARLQFRRCEMNGIDFEQYYSELKRLLAFCKFSESSREERLVEQIIHGVSDDSIRNKLTAVDEIALEDVLKECRSFYANSVEESSTGSPINQTETTDQHSEQSSNILNGNKSPDSLVENFQELPASKLTAKQTEADTPNSFRPITTAEELFSTTPSESNVIKLLDSESTDPGSEVSKSVDDQKDESEDAADIITVSSKTISLKKAAKGGKAMTLKLKRIDNDLLEKHEKTVKSSSKANSVINGESEDTTSHELQTFSLNTSGNATTSDDELNLALVKKKQEQSTRSEHVTTESSKSAKSTAETSAKSEANIAASESEQSSSESSESSEDEKVEEIATPESNQDSDFEVSSKSNDNVRRSRRIKKDKKSKEKQKKKENEKNNKHGKGKRSRKRGIDNLNVSDEISDSDENDKKISLVSDDEDVVKARPGNRKKRRKFVIDEEDSDNNGTTEDTADATSTEVGDKEKKSAKKENEDNDEQDENESPTKAGRKNIRQILSTKDLEKDTRKANIEERERRKRISEKSKDGMTDFYTREKDKRVVYTRLCFEKKKDEDLVYMNEELVSHLKPHQVEGVQFLWDCTVESASRAKETQGSGAILAHCMGLGKTLQVISFVHTMLSCEALPFKTALIIVPANTILNWVNEFEIWMPEEEELAVFEISQYKDDKVRADVLSRWRREGGVMIIGYNMFRMFVNPTRKKAKRHYDKVKSALLDPGPDFVVCDEGHLLKNDQTALSKAVSQIKSRRRIVLTGTPLQNNLVEYHCMVNFVKQNLLGTKNEFRNRFINPISNGQQKDARALDVKVMKRRSHVLHELLAGCVQRRDYCYITKYLPPKYEYVLSIRMSERQVRLYNLYLRTFCFEQYGSSDDSSADSLIIPKEHQVVRRDGTRSLFKDFQMLARIWTHPYCLKLIPPKDSISDMSDEDSFVTDASDDDKRRKNKRGDKGGLDNDNNKPSTSGVQGGEGNSKRRRKESSGGSENASVKDVAEQEDSDDDGSDLSSKEVIKKYKTATGRGSGRRAREMSPLVEEQFWYSDILQEEDQFNISLSGKLVLLCEVLKSASEWKDKVLVFSQSLMTLTLIEDTLAMITEAKNNNWKVGEKDSEGFTRAVDGTETGEGTWVPNKDYLRLDGGSSVPLRKKMCDQFNSKSNRRCRLFLISTKAGSLGINLVSANRVIIFDASWNPSHDIQSMFRCYRFGQKKPVYVYRFIGQGTMEEKIYNRQVTKESLSLRVVDENQIDRHFSKDELDDLYQFEPNLYCENDPSVPLCDVPKDDLLADLMIRRKDILYKYHQHDSLLEHQADQNLSEEDKRAAWEEYERERQGGPNAAQVRQQQMREQMMANNMTALQQQYLRQQQHSISLQQQVHDAKYLEKACHDMINWGASIGVPGANKQSAALSIQSFNDAIRRMSPSITFKQMGDKVYDLFPNYYLNSLGIQNPRFAPTEDANQVQLQQLQQTQQLQQNNSTSNHVNQGFGVNDVQLNASNRQETVNLSSSDTAMNERNMPNATPHESATSSNASESTTNPGTTETQSASESFTSSSS